MRTLLELELPGLPPTVNHLYRSMKSGRRYKTAEGRDYQEQVSLLMRRAAQGELPNTHSLELEILFTVKDKRRWDIDNRVKALQDCLTMSGIIHDDSQIDALHVRRKRTSTPSSTYIRVSECEEQAV